MKWLNGFIYALLGVWMVLTVLILMALLSGCISHPRKPEPMPVQAVITAMDDTMKEVVSRLVWSRIEPVEHEVDIFAY